MKKQIQVTPLPAWVTVAAAVVAEGPVVVVAAAGLTGLTGLAALTVLAAVVLAVAGAVRWRPAAPRPG